MSPRRAVAVGAAVALGAGWVVALLRLWPATVPGDLQLHQLSGRALLQHDVLARSVRFARVERLLALAQQLVVLAVVAVYARRGAAFARESAAGPIGTGMLLGMLGLALVWLAALPLRFVDFWWVKDHGILRTDWVSFVVGDYFGLGAQFAAAALELAIIMGLARGVRRWWPVLAVPLVAAVQLGLVLLAPVLVGPLDTVSDPHLRADARRLARIEGVRDVRLRVQDVHEETSAPNAEAIGVGRDGGHVILWDTLLRHGFRRQELDVVIAHEIGHLRHRDTLRLVAFLVLMLVPLTVLVERATRRRGGMACAEAVPVALLVVVAFSLVTQPLSTAFSRDVEAAADWAALDATRDPAAARTMFQRLAATSLSPPGAPWWAHALYDDHPTLAARVAMADAWAARHRGR